MRAERVLIIPAWERENRSDSWTIYVEEESGQISLVGTFDIGPFETLTDLTQRLARSLVAAGVVMF